MERVRETLLPQEEVTYTPFGFQNKWTSVMQLRMGLSSARRCDAC